MREIHERIFVGNIDVCTRSDDERAVVHACKRPCHKRAVGYDGNPSPAGEDYLFRREADDLYLNMVDAPQPKYFGDELFEQAMQFMYQHWEAGREVLVHCKKGRSRAPSIGLLFLAARIDRLPTETFAAARREFEELYPKYTPNSGIEAKLRENWSQLLEM